MIAYVGVDWSGKEAACAVAFDAEPVRNAGTIAASLHDVEEFVDCLQQDGADEVHVVVQAGSRFWVRVFREAGVHLHVVDPKQSRRFEESMTSSEAKDDRREARALCEMGRSPRHCPEEWAPSAHAELDRLGAVHEKLINQRCRTSNRLRALVRDDMPLIDACLPHIRTKWVLDWLRAHPTSRHVQERANDIADNPPSRAWPKRRAQLVETAQSTRSLLTDEEVELQEFMVIQLLDTMEHLNAHIDEVAKRIERLVAASTEGRTVRSIPGFGPILSAAILRFGLGKPLEDRDDLAVRLGASPVFIGSGRNRHGQPKGITAMRRSVSSSASRAAYLIGFLSVRQMKWANAMYAYGRSRGHKPAAVYRRISRSLTRIVFAMLRDGTVYDEEKYVAALKARGVEWAMAL